MLPRVIMHNSISVDGSVRDFELDIGLHYEIADKMHADAHLIGSKTAKMGIEMITENVPPEEPQDFVKPVIKPDDTKPYYVLSDSKGKLKGIIHVYSYVLNAYAATICWLFTVFLATLISSTLVTWIVKPKRNSWNEKDEANR